MKQKNCFTVIILTQHRKKFITWKLDTRTDWADPGTHARTGCVNFSATIGSQEIADCDDILVISSSCRLWISGVGSIIRAVDDKDLRNSCTRSRSLYCRRKLHKTMDYRNTPWNLDVPILCDGKLSLPEIMRNAPRLSSFRTRLLSMRQGNRRRDSFKST